VNLVFAVLGVVFAVLAGLFMLLLRGSREEQRSGAGYTVVGELAMKRGLLWFAVALVLAIVGVVVFFLTEDMSLPMGMVDKWTIVNAVLLVVEVLAIIFVYKTVKQTKTVYTISNAKTSATDKKA
jgi:heme/copper-type cytochrome/quinol oxidase subunit 2